MSVVLLALLLSTSPSAPPPSVTPQSPDEEVEAWNPIGTPEAGVARPPRDPHNDTAQAFDAIVPVAGGVFVGALGTVALAIAASALPFGAAPVAAFIVGGLLVVGTPALFVALALPELPGWTPWLTAALVPVGGLVFGAAMLATSSALVWATRRPEDDCAMCGLGGLVVTLGTPIAAAVGAVAGGLTATTMAAYAAQEE